MKQMNIEPSERAADGDLDLVWRRATAAFSNIRAMRFSTNWFYGVSRNSPDDRLQKLIASKKSQRLGEILAPLDNEQLRQFVARTSANLELANAAMRSVFVLNISAPVGFLVVFNQLAPGFIASQLAGDGFWFVIGVCGFVVAAVLVAIAFTHAGVTQARELRLLSELALAQRATAGIATAFKPELEIDDPAIETDPTVLA